MSQACAFWGVKCRIYQPKGGGSRQSTTLRFGDYRSTLCLSATLPEFDSSAKCHVGAAEITSGESASPHIERSWQRGNRQASWVRSMTDNCCSSPNTPLTPLTALNQKFNRQQHKDSAVERPCISGSQGCSDDADVATVESSMHVPALTTDSALQPFPIRRSFTCSVSRSRPSWALGVAASYATYDCA